MKHAIVFGVSGGIGKAMVDALLDRHDEINIFTPIRNGKSSATFDCLPNQKIIQMNWDSNDESTLGAIADHFKTNDIQLDYSIAAIGALHSDEIKPEKKLGQLSHEQMSWYFHANAITHALIIKHISPLMTKSSPSFMSHLTARVGSISDNKLGGWYSYRAAKAALHMILKTAAIEMQRYNKQLIVLGIHPGSVDTNLSKPFQNHIPEHKLFTPEYAANNIFDHVLDKLTADHSGNVFAYDGQKIPE